MIEERIDAGMQGSSSGALVGVGLPEQQRLPLPWNLARRGHAHRFAHPAEAELGRILTFYGVRWVYEPTNFVLRWTADGRPAESFAPDFYIPAHRLYIELTTMRQPLVTRKNRKLRRLRELFPGIRIKLLYRRDVERLFGAYDEPFKLQGNCRTGDVIAGPEQIGRRIEELAERIAASGLAAPARGGEADAGLVLLSYEPAAGPFRDALAGALQRCGIPVVAAGGILMRYDRRIGRKTSSFIFGRGTDLARRPVLLVSDLVSSGLSAGYMLEWARKQGARAAELCTLFDRRNARLLDLDVRYAAFAAPDGPVAGFGIGRDEALACLPHIVALHPG